MMDFSPPALDGIDGLISPSLVIFRDRVAANIQRMISMAGGADRLRPHVKTHKMAEVVRMPFDQFQTGAGLVLVADRPGLVAGFTLGPLDLVGCQRDSILGIDGCGGKGGRNGAQECRRQKQLLEHDRLPVVLRAA